MGGRVDVKSTCTGKGKAQNLVGDERRAVHLGQRLFFIGPGDRGWYTLRVQQRMLFKPNCICIRLVLVGRLIIIIEHASQSQLVHPEMLIPETDGLLLVPQLTLPMCVCTSSLPDTVPFRRVGFVKVLTQTGLVHLGMIHQFQQRVCFGTISLRVIGLDIASISFFGRRLKV